MSKQTLCSISATGAVSIEDIVTVYSPATLRKQSQERKRIIMEGSNIEIKDTDIQPYMNNVVEFDVTESTTFALHDCRKKIMRPYLILMSVLGWRPIMMADNLSDASIWDKMINNLYTFMITVTILVGYALQYASCLRQDGYQPYNTNTVINPNNTLVFTRNLSSINETQISLKNDNCMSKQYCSGNFVSLYVIPDMFHFFAYLCMAYFTRKFSEEPQDTEFILENVYLEVSQKRGRKRAHLKLFRTLASFLFICMVWVVLSFICHFLHIFAFSEICFTWLQSDSDSWNKFTASLTLITLTWNDIICASIVTNYLVQCQLQRVYIHRLIINIQEHQYCEDIRDFMPRYAILRKFIGFLNGRHALGVVLLTANFGCRAVVILYGLISHQIVANLENKIIIWMTSLLWIALVSLPICFAMLLTNACDQLREMGHIVRSRKYGYEQLKIHLSDSFLLYTSNIKIEARMLCIPIRAENVMRILLLTACVLLFLGQINVITY